VVPRSIVLRALLPRRLLPTIRCQPLAPCLSTNTTATWANHSMVTIPWPLLLAGPLHLPTTTLANTVQFLYARYNTEPRMASRTASLTWSGSSSLQLDSSSCSSISGIESTSCGSGMGLGHMRMLKRQAR
jgi:hypothetical protein